MYATSLEMYIYFTYIYVKLILKNIYIFKKYLLK